LPTHRIPATATHDVTAPPSNGNSKIKKTPPPAKKLHYIGANRALVGFFAVPAISLACCCRPQSSDGRHAKADTKEHVHRPGFPPKPETTPPEGDRPPKFCSGGDFQFSEHDGDGRLNPARRFQTAAFDFLKQASSLEERVKTKTRHRPRNYRRPREQDRPQLESRGNLTTQHRELSSENGLKRGTSTGRCGRT